MKWTIAICFCLAAVVGCAHKQREEFPISYWCGPPEKFVTPDRYAEIRDANFTIAFPACGGATTAMNHRILACCRKVGLKAFITVQGGMPLAMNTPALRSQADKIIAEYRSEPALAGYFLADEPGPTAFATLGQVAAYFRENDPTHPVFINLLPNYAPEWAIGASYANYLDQFLTTVKPAVLSYDHYFMTTGRDGSLFFPNLEAARAASVKHQTPFWNIVQVTQFGPYRNLSEAELRFEAMQTLAYGGKGILWFTYWTPADPSFAWTHAIVHADGTRDEHYAMIRAVNADVLAIGGELFHAESISLHVKGNLTIGQFLLNDRKMTLIANRDYKNSSVAETDPAKEKFDPLKRKWRKLAAKSVTIPPGAAVLLR